MKGYKPTVGEEKMLVTSVLPPHQNNSIPNKPWFFTCLQYNTFENTVGKVEIARYEQFLLFPPCFLSFWRTLLWQRIRKCRLQILWVWKSLKFVVWERVKLQHVTVCLFRGKYTPWCKIRMDNIFSFLDCAFILVCLHSANLGWWDPSNPSAVTGGRICIKSMHNRK